jgi:hypothetical protein
MAERISLKDIAIAIGDKIVGGAEELSVTVSRDNELAYQGGSYKAVEIVDGKFDISGTITKAFLDTEILREICPNRDLWPSFTIVGEVVNSKKQRRITLFGAKFDSVDINSLSIDGYAKNALPFKALDWDY